MNVIEFTKMMKANTLDVKTDYKVVGNMIKSKRESMHEVGSRVQSKEKCYRKAKEKLKEDINHIGSITTQAEDMVVGCENVHHHKREGRATFRETDRIHLGVLVEKCTKF